MTELLPYISLTPAPHKSKKKNISITAFYEYNIAYHHLKEMRYLHVPFMGKRI